MNSILVKGALIVLILVGVQYSAYSQEAQNSTSACLTIAEQKELGTIFVHHDEAVAKDPNCVNGRGASACISPYELTMKNAYINRLKDLFKGKVRGTALLFDLVAAE